MQTTTKFTAKVSQKELKSLIARAKSREINVDIRTKGDVDNIYFNDKLVAERMPGYANVFVEVDVLI